MYMTEQRFDYTKMTEEQFQQATKEFLENGGVVQQLPYRSSAVDTPTK